MSGSETTHSITSSASASSVGGISRPSAFAVFALLPYSGIYQEVEAGQLSMALLPWMGAERVLALPRGRPISRATRETAALLKEICGDLIKSGIIRTAPRTTVRPGRK